MRAEPTPLDRRRFLRRVVLLGATCWTTRGVFAEELAASAHRKFIVTPGLTEGPFYPDKMPLDTDNDLLLVNDAITPAVGEVTYVSGRVLSETGAPLRNAFVEIWQCDVHGSYIHRRGRNPDGSMDGNFQGYGRFMTGSDGQYLFRTIKPVPYNLNGMSRTPHIHFAVSQGGKRILTTQMMVRGHPDNSDDHVLNRVREAAARETLLVNFQPLPGTRLGELSANFNLVLGATAAEEEDGSLRGGIGPARRRGRRD